MKRIITLIVLTLSYYNAFCQEAGKFRFQMDLGAVVPQDGGIGALINFEPQLLLMDNLAFGMRLGSTGFGKEITYYEVSENFDGILSFNSSVLGTINYYFIPRNKEIIPFVGVGFGYFALSNVRLEDHNFDNDRIEVRRGSFGWAPMLRAGIELGKFRIGAEYNFVPDSDLQSVEGDWIGTTSNKYLGFTFGYFVGGGKWKQ
ncbi:hypothetical protein [Algoriphagus marincola]|uniref:hypothetical protein n=1 Tax=Algoriphagus marincola TaxID=264027 RepID=UPI00047E0783|nr:hypothetical protein [Algoriphagus marincola]